MKPTLTLLSTPQLAPLAAHTAGAKTTDRRLP